MEQNSPYYQNSHCQGFVTAKTSKISEQIPGGSYVAGPLGNVIAKGGEKEEIVYVDINPTEVTRSRWSTKLLRDYRPELYGILSDAGK